MKGKNKSDTPITDALFGGEDGPFNMTVKEVVKSKIFLIAIPIILFIIY